jgi:hypothetical protein
MAPTAGLTHALALWQSIKEILDDLTMVKDVWDTAMLCELQFSDWSELP